MQIETWAALENIGCFIVSTEYGVPPTELRQARVTPMPLHIIIINFDENKLFQLKPNDRQKN